MAVTPILLSLLWILVFACDTLIHCSTKSCMTLCSNTVGFNGNNPVSLSPLFPFSLAEELYQKVQRLFGKPHQATEDLKAEVTINFTYLSSVLLNEWLNTSLSSF